MEVLPASRDECHHQSRQGEEQPAPDDQRAALPCPALHRPLLHVASHSSGPCVLRRWEGDRGVRFLSRSEVTSLLYPCWPAWSQLLTLRVVDMGSGRRQRQAKYCMYHSRPTTWASSASASASASAPARVHVSSPPWAVTTALADHLTHLWSDYPAWSRRARVHTSLTHSPHPYPITT